MPVVVRCMANAALAPTPFVHPPGYAMHDLMNALEVMDPLMDGGMAYPPALLPPRERTSEPRKPFPTSLTDKEVCWVLDRLVACELEWLGGATLSQTLYTCTYVHECILPDKKPSDHWCYIILHAYLIAMLKGCALQWLELTRQRVVDGEDFSGDLGGLAMPDGIDAREAAAQLDYAATHIAEAQAPALQARLRWRQHWLGAVAAMTSEVPDATRIDWHLSVCRRIWVQLCPSTASHDILPLQDAALASAPTLLQAFFDITLSRHFSTSIPMRPLGLRDAPDVWERWHHILHEQVVLPLPLLHTHHVADWWKHLRTQALSFQHHTPIPFVRSLLATYVSDGYTCGGGQYDLTSLATDWLEEWTTLSIDDLGTRLEWLDTRDSTAGHARRFARFLERFAGLVADHLSTYAANRARQKRCFGKAYATWADLIDDAEALSEHIALSLPTLSAQGLLVPPIQFLALASMEQAIGAGFELELYDDDELPYLYWLLADIKGEQMTLLANSPADPSSVHAAAAERHLCLVQCLVRLPCAPDDATRVRHAFARRLKWLHRPAWCARARLHLVTQPDSHVAEPLWEQWEAFQQHFAASTDPSTCISTHVQTCLSHLASNESLASHIPWLTSEAHMRGIREACEALGALVRAAPLVENVTWTTSLHPWYPLPTWS
ncbi:N-alpha-acetyltransferase, non-catalitic subunit [Malassezia nana]|uniref:N-alpha-acetyltransferase, non-catalitic subunit n=1 Tax=Malassezia nana TaxID=180528 RepID=A0AAF0J2L5_9BASI|nr:N-alpha-acetyltransferase, non-catalitic subunit [Malassezia nana]